MREDRYLFSGICFLVIALVTAPYLYAYLAAGPDYVFGGFLLNPLDGNSYLAKMYQGWQGHWLFQFLYNANPGDGAYLFIFYVFLGHLARVFFTPLILMFHLVRLGGTLVMLFELYKFMAVQFVEANSRRLAFTLVALGSGVGWAALLFGQLTSDFWVAESYPFLSSYANPHFPFSLAIMIWLLVPKISGKVYTRNREIKEIIAACLLSIMSPFGIVLIGLIEAGLFLWKWIIVPHKPLKQLLSEQVEDLYGLARLVLGGGPMLVYYLWVVKTNPVFVGWNIQNITPAPPLWDLVVSLSPAFMLAILGVCYVYRRKIASGRLLFIWFFLTFALLYFPLNLQRRFILGIYIPLASLAVYGVQYLAQLQRNSYRSLSLGLLIISIPTNIIILLVAKIGVDCHSPEIYLTKGENQALVWIEKHTKPDSLILAAPGTGVFIPAHTGRRVYYGHPYETVNAEDNKAIVERFFMGLYRPEDIEYFKGVDYIFWGPRERNVFGLTIPDGVPVVYQNSDVVIYIWDDSYFIR